MRTRRRTPLPEPGDAPGTWTLGPDTELYDPPDEVDPYPVRPVHPAARAMARVGLWGAVVIGCLGGLVGLASPQAGTGPAARPAAAPASAGVPGPVAGIAERAVVAWLTATDGEALDDLFLDAPGTPGGEPVEVLAAQAITGDPTGEGTWAVTVAVDVRHTVDEDEEPLEVTWYAELAVVGDEARGLRVLAAPALVPAPVGPDAWRAQGDGARRLDAEDPLAVMVTGFLRALVVGQGDPAPYLAPDVEVAPVRPAPFSALEVVSVRAESTGENEARVWVAATGTAGRASYAVGYQVDAVQSDGRWQVAAVTGAAAADAVEGDEDDDDGTPAGGDPSDERSGDGGGSGSPGTGGTRVPVDASNGEDADTPSADPMAEEGAPQDDPGGIDDVPPDDPASTGPGT